MSINTIDIRPRHYAKPSRPHQFKEGEKVYSKRISNIGAFHGTIIGARGSGFQILNPKTGNTYQRDRWDLIPIDEAGAEVKEREGVE